jgi:hypothetical protein
MLLLVVGVVVVRHPRRAILAVANAPAVLVVLVGEVGTRTGGQWWGGGRRRRGGGGRGRRWIARFAPAGRWHGTNKGGPRADGSTAMRPAVRPVVTIATVPRVHAVRAATVAVAVAVRHAATAAISPVATTAVPVHAPSAVAAVPAHAVPAHPAATGRRAVRVARVCALELPAARRQVSLASVVAVHAAVSVPATGVSA